MPEHIIDEMSSLLLDLQADIGKTQTREAYIRANQRALEASRILNNLLNLATSAILDV